jgi:hypothetical protein
LIFFQLQKKIKIEVFELELPHEHFSPSKQVVAFTHFARVLKDLGLNLVQVTISP